MHLWHDLSPGERAPEYVDAVIEVPKGSSDKYELDKATSLLRLDRVLYSAVYYPTNYGFIPQTYCDDDDPLDILVLSEATIFPLTIVSCRVIGVMRMLDNGEADDKIIAVAEHDQSVNHNHDIEDLAPHFGHEVRAFFEDYKKLEHKTVAVEDILGKEAAIPILEDAIKLYNDEIAPKLGRQQPLAD